MDKLQIHVSGPALIGGRVLSGTVTAFMLLDAGMKILGLQPVLDTAHQLGWPADAETWRMLGLVLLAATLLYAWPRTALLGAVALTAFLGGAVATHVRIGSPLFSHVLFGVYVGLALWGGLWLRMSHLRALFPLRSLPPKKDA